MILKYDGKHWKVQDSGIIGAPKSFCFTDAKNGWAVGGNLILHTKNGGVLTGVNKPVVQSSKFKVQCYPNPANQSVSINYQLTIKSNINLRVYNLLGNVIETLVNEEKEKGNYSINFNAKNLYNGVYFYKIVAGKI